MLFQKHVLSMAVILAMGTVPAFATQTVKNAAPSSASKSASKPAAIKTHSIDGSLVVALEDIDVEPGPDYHVYVVGGRDRRSPGDGVELAKLKGNQGTQYYEVPRDVTVGAGDTVLIWCRAFGVPVANATQA